MNPLKEQINKVENKLDKFLDIYYRTNFIDKQVYQNKAYFMNDVYLPERIAFFGANTVTTKQPAITSPSGGTTIDAEARTAINTIINTLKVLGLTN